MKRALVTAVHATIGVLFVGLLAIQVSVPLVARDVIETTFPEAREILVPYSIAADLAIVCVEVVLVAIWLLVAMVAREQVPSQRAVRWCDVIVASAVIATVLTAGVMAHMLVTSIGNLVALVAMLGVLAVGVLVTLLAAMARQLLVVALGRRGEKTTAGSSPLKV